MLFTYKHELLQENFHGHKPFIHINRHNILYSHVHVTCQSTGGVISYK